MSKKIIEPTPEIKHVKVITINGDEEVRVTNDEENFYFRPTQMLNSCAMKCSGCTEVTVHQLMEINFGTVFESAPGETQPRRLALCMFCGKNSFK